MDSRPLQLRKKNFSYMLFVACALGAGLPGMHKVYQDSMSRKGILNWHGACLASTTAIVVYLVGVCVLQLRSIALYERLRVFLETFYLTGLCFPFVLSVYFSGMGVRDLFWQAVVHLCLVPFLDLPCTSTLIAALVLCPLYLALDWHDLHEHKITLAWRELLARQLGSAGVWVGGMVVMHVLTCELPLKPAAKQDGERAAATAVSPLQRCEDWLLHQRQRLSPQDRTLLLAMLFGFPPVFCFVKCIRPFFEADSSPAGPFELYIAFLCMYLLGTLEVDHLRSSLLRRLQLSQDLLCDMLPSHVVLSLLEANGIGRSRPTSRQMSLDGTTAGPHQASTLARKPGSDQDLTGRSQHSEQYLSRLSNCRGSLDMQQAPERNSSDQVGVNPDLLVNLSDTFASWKAVDKIASPRLSFEPFEKLSTVCEGDGRDGDKPIDLIPALPVDTPHESQDDATDREAGGPVRPDPCRSKSVPALRRRFGSRSSSFQADVTGSTWEQRVRKVSLEGGAWAESSPTSDQGHSHRSPTPARTWSSEAYPTQHSTHPRASSERVSSASRSTGGRSSSGGASQQTGSSERKPQLLPNGAPAPPGSLMAEWHENITILFADVVGFTDMAQQCSPDKVMRMLDSMYMRFDDLCVASGNKVYKVETIGDCYMCATGLMMPDPDHAQTALDFAVAMRRAAMQVKLPTTGLPVRIRIGIHSGRAMSGIVGKLRRRYCLFGDTVNTASRMESTGSPGCIHISDETYVHMARMPAYQFRCRGTVEVKGKGSMTTWWVETANATHVGPEEHVTSAPLSPPLVASSAT